MRHYTLKQINAFNSLWDYLHPNKVFAPERMIMDLGLYEGLLIDASDLFIGEEDVYDDNNLFFQYSEEHVVVSKDIQALHKFLKWNKSLLLPCADCKDVRTFLRKSNTYHKSLTPTKTLFYSFLNDKLIAYDQEQDNYLNSSLTPSHKTKLAYHCIEGILNNCSTFGVTLECTADLQHCITTFFVIHRAKDYCDQTQDPDQNLKVKFNDLSNYLIIEKVGQDPSLADMQLFDIKKYRHILPDERFNDFRTAIGLYASGVGCGSLFYLRRVFECIVEMIKSDCEKLPEWDAKTYHDADFNDKVKYLESLGKKIIPDELSNVRTIIYGGLSKGVHGMTDKEATSLFPYFKFTIEMILDEQIIQKEKAKKIKELNKTIGSIK